MAAGRTDYYVAAQMAAGGNSVVVCRYARQTTRTSSARQGFTVARPMMIQPLHATLIRRYSHERAGNPYVHVHHEHHGNAHIVGVKNARACSFLSHRGATRAGHARPKGGRLYTRIPVGFTRGYLSRGASMKRLEHFGTATPRLRPSQDSL